MVVNMAFDYKGVSITWFGHASFMIKGSKTIYIDPYVLPEDPEPADIIIYTHKHFDHCVEANKIRKQGTIAVGPCEFSDKKLSAGEQTEVKGIKIQAVEAYNIGKPFHPKGLGIGVIVEIDGVRIYHAGDTDFIPEMKDYRCDIALLPIGGTYTMDEEDAAKATKAINPEIVIPMHFNYLDQTKANPEYFSKLVGKYSNAKVVILTNESNTSQ